MLSPVHCYVLVTSVNGAILIGAAYTRSHLWIIAAIVVALLLTVLVWRWLHKRLSQEIVSASIDVYVSQLHAARAARRPGDRHTLATEPEVSGHCESPRSVQ